MNRIRRVAGTISASVVLTLAGVVLAAPAQAQDDGLLGSLKAQLTNTVSAAQEQVQGIVGFAQGQVEGVVADV
ncbi:hypothetical protein [Streptomyces abikoensis]